MSLKLAPSLDPIKKLKKENLAKVASHYGITPAAGAKTSHILDLIEDHCVENDIINEVEEKPTAETEDVLRLKLEFEHEEQPLAREKALEIAKQQKLKLKELAKQQKLKLKELVKLQKQKLKELVI